MFTKSKLAITGSIRSRFSLNLIVTILIFALFPSCVLQSQETLSDIDEGTITIKKQYLKELKDSLLNGDSTLEKAYEKLISDAERYMDTGPFSVVYKNHTPPSGNKHDYMTLSTYAWPNPDTEDGLPYVMIDGKKNPEVDKYDRVPLGQLSHSVFTLALAYYYSEDNRYASKAADLIRTWFLNEGTYMRPHLKYAQSIPGKNKGSSHGIIETRDFIDILNAVGLIYESSHWEPKDQYELKLWFNIYLDWLLNSSVGKAASRKESNHSTWYDAQTTAFAIFTEKDDLANSILEKTFNKRASNQINTMGVQEAEISRWRSQYYSWFNLKAMLTNVYIGDKTDWEIDMSSTTASRISMALNWLMPYVQGTKEWNYSQVTEFDYCRYIDIYRAAALKFENKEYEKIAQKLIQDGCNDTTSLLIYPPLKTSTKTD